MKSKLLFLPALLILASACAPAATPPAPTAKPTEAKPTEAPKPAAPVGQPAATTAPAAKPAEAAKPAAPAGPAQKLVVTSGGVCICHAPLYVGIEKGIFQKNGLDIEVRRVASGFEGLSALQTGDANVADAVVAVVAQAAQQGVEVTAVLMANGDPTGTRPTDNYFAIVASKASNIRENNLEDLKGKKIGVARGTIAHQYLHYALKAKGIDSGKDVTLQNVGPADLPSALQSGSVDVIVSWEPVALQAQGMVPDSVTVYRGGNHIQYLFQRWMAPKFISSDPAAVKKFVTGFAEAAQFARQNTDETVEIVAKNFQGLDKQIIRTSLGYLNFDPRYSKASQEAVQQGLDFATEVGAFKGTYTFAEHLELRFLNEVQTERPELFSDLPPIPAALQLGS